MRRRRPGPRTGTGEGPIRITFLTPSLHPGGAERQMLLLAAMLPRPAFEVSFVLLWERGGWAAEADALGVPVHVLGLRPADIVRLRPRSVIAAARALRRYLALTRNVDIVDAWLVPSFTFAAFARPLGRGPILIAGRRSLLSLYERKPWYRKAAAAWATGRADAVVANSQAGAAEAVLREHIDPRRVRVIPNAVVPVTVTPPERDALRRGWGFSADDLVVGCVANYKPEKGLESLLQAAASLRETAPRLRYVLVGEGPLRDLLEDRIRSADMGSLVVLHGKAADARLLYPAFDIAVQASETEGLPNVVLEAASAGLPIVATAVGGTPEVLTTEENGLLVPSGDPDRLAAAIFRMASDPDLRARLGRAAFERSQAYAATRLAERTAALYQRLARPPAAGGPPGDAA